MPGRGSVPEARRGQRIKRELFQDRDHGERAPGEATKGGQLRYEADARKRTRGDEGEGELLLL